MASHTRPQPTPTDHELNQYLADAADGDALPEVTPDLRRARILDYEATSLTKPDSLEACVGASNSDLMKIGLHLSTVINPALENLDLANLNQLLPALDTQLRVVRQIERLAQFEARITEAREKARAAGSLPRRRPVVAPRDRRIG